MGRQAIDVSVVAWCAWFTKSGGEFRYYDSITSAWEDLPAEGALMFVLFQRTRGYRRTMSGVSLYWHDPRSEIYACDNREDALIPEDLPDKWIKKGKWVTDQDFREVTELALAARTAPDESLLVDR